MVDRQCGYKIQGLSQTPRHTSQESYLSHPWTTRLSYQVCTQLEPYQYRPLFNVYEAMVRPDDVLYDIRNLPLINCGQEAKEHFSFADGYINLNHGSFGTYPSCIKEVLRHYQDCAEAQPDKFIRYDYPILLDASRAAIAKEVHAPVDACVFVPNATTGVNTVLRALEYEKGDVIIYFSTIYGACEKTVTFITETTHAESRKIQLTYPISDDALGSQFEALIEDIKKEGKNPKIAIFDAITSMPGVRVPFEDLTEICYQHKVLSCIDAAHSVGQIEINLTKLDPDFFVSNLHKWLYVPRSCALFYVPVRNQHMIRSTVPTSHGFTPKPTENGEAIANPLPPSAKSPFITQFEFVGTLDNSAYLCVPAALEWRKKLVDRRRQGEDAIRSYITWLAFAACVTLSEKFGTEYMETEDRTLTRCAMTNVRLPLSYEEIAGGSRAIAIKVAQWMATTIVDEYNTFLAICVHGNAWWVRFSGQIYLTLEDVDFGAEVLEKVCQRVRDGEWKL